MIRAARLRRGLTQRQLADKMGIGQASVWFAEHHDTPTLFQLERFARVLGFRLEVRYVDLADPAAGDIT